MVLVDGVIVIAGRYPDDVDLIDWLELPPEVLGYDCADDMPEIGEECCCDCHDHEGHGRAEEREHDGHHHHHGCGCGCGHENYAEDGCSDGAEGHGHGRHHGHH